MTITVRPYADDDLAALQAALAQWTRQAGRCGYGHVGDLPHRIYENLGGRRPVGDLVQVWEEGPVFAGVSICGRFDVAFDVFTAPEHRGTAGELEMLRAAEETTRRHMRTAGVDTTEPSPITDVYGCDTVRAQLLGRMGFEQYRIWDHVTVRSLVGSIPAPSLPPGFAIRSATEDDAVQLASVRNATFGTSWSTSGYLEQVMRQPGYDGGRELVVVSPDERIAAFTVIWFDDLNAVGLFEPVGTHPDFRRLGLARALLRRGLDVMHRRGMGTAMVQHDAANVAAGALYQGLGFRTCDETLGFRGP